jgi:hypothetical protein
MKTRLGNILSNKKISYIQRVPLPKDDSFSEIEDLIIGKVNELWIAYDRICDHNGGTLYLDKNRTTATWIFQLLIEAFNLLNAKMITMKLSAN